MEQRISCVQLRPIRQLHRSVPLLTSNRITSLPAPKAGRLFYALLRIILPEDAPHRRLMLPASMLYTCGFGSVEPRLTYSTPVSMRTYVGATLVVAFGTFAGPSGHPQGAPPYKVGIFLRQC